MKKNQGFAAVLAACQRLDMVRAPRKQPVSKCIEMVASFQPFWHAKNAKKARCFLEVEGLDFLKTVLDQQMPLSVWQPGEAKKLDMKINEDNF